MIDSVDSNIIDTQEHYLKEYGQEKFTDIHCHCLFGLDDGPATMAESLALCQRLVEENIATVVATPHQLGRFDGSNTAANIREAVNDLNKGLRNNYIPIKVVPGGEVRADERIGQFLEADKILTLADGGKYILLELPYYVFPNIELLLKELASTGIQPVISHAEKIASLATHHQMILKWLEHPVHLQITASSLLGDFGPDVQKIAWYMLTSGLVTFVATDSHDMKGRRPKMRTAFGRIRTKLGENLARLVCIENPSRLINGKDILPTSIYDR